MTNKNLVAIIFKKVS